MEEEEEEVVVVVASKRMDRQTRAWLVAEAEAGEFPVSKNEEKRRPGYKIPLNFQFRV